jgi:hypothetical protein
VHTPKKWILCASSEGWRVQWESVPPGQKSGPRSFGSRIAWETGILQNLFENFGMFALVSSYTAAAFINVPVNDIAFGVGLFITLSMGALTFAWRRSVKAGHG